METYTTKQLKKMIKNGNDTQSILAKHFSDTEQEFNTLINQLYDLLQKVQTFFLDANFYTASGGFNLLIGNPYNDDYEISSN